MKIEAILTYNNKPQEFVYESVNPSDIDAIMKSDQSLFEYLVDSSLSDEDQKDLVKISVCIYSDSYIPPAWYMEANGKLWVKDGKLY